MNKENTLDELFENTRRLCLAFAELTYLESEENETVIRSQYDNLISKIIKQIQAETVREILELIPEEGKDKNLGDGYKSEFIGKPFHDACVRLIKKNIEYYVKENLLENPQDTTGISTGWGNLDRKTSGLHGTDLIILAARPAMGKSSFALQLARNIAVGANTPTFFFSLEMGAEQLIQRLVSCESKVELNKLKSGRISDIELQALELGAEIIKQSPLFFNDKAGMQLKDMRASIKSHNAKHKDKIGFVVVDYLQLMATGKNTSNMVTEVTEISRGLKMLAKDFNIPVLALSQLSRRLDDSFTRL